MFGDIFCHDRIPAFVIEADPLIKPMEEELPLFVKSQGFRSELVLLNDHLGVVKGELFVLLECELFLVDFKIG